MLGSFKLEEGWGGIENCWALAPRIWLWLSKPMGSHFGVGEFTTHFRTYFSGIWEVHWGYDLAFDPWPYVSGLDFGRHVGGVFYFLNWYPSLWVV